MSDRSTLFRFFLISSLLFLCSCLSSATTERHPSETSEQMYQRGLDYGKTLEPGVAEGGEDAISWFQQSAAQGYLPAVHALGWMYFEGRGVVKDLTRAEQYFRRAASLGYAESQYLLGIFYAQGWVVKKNSVTALQWMKKAADQGHVDARRMFNSLSQTPPPTGK